MTHVIAEPCIDITQALELSLLEARGVHARLLSRSEGEPWRPSAPVRLPGPGRENFLRHTLVTWEDGAPRLDWKPVTMTKWQPEERKY